MSQLVRLEGKNTAQSAHCAMALTLPITGSTSLVLVSLIVAKMVTQNHGDDDDNDHGDDREPGRRKECGSLVS